jgi:hypothetical protein
MISDSDFTYLDMERKWLKDLPVFHFQSNRTRES